jgi:hypothetical protein
VRGTIRERSRNSFENARDIAQDIVVPETQDPIVVTGKPKIADHVMAVVSMLPAIHFNDDTGFAANKVDGVWANRFLPNKSVTAERARTELAPQRKFGIGCITSQSPGAFRPNFSCTAHAEAPPHPDRI